jgi:hypothetical protein
MAFKIYTTGNYLFIEDLLTDNLYQGLKKEIRVSRDLKNENVFNFISLNDNGLQGIDWQECVDLNNLSFNTINEFIDFYTQNTGNYDSSGGTSVDYTTLLEEIRDELRDDIQLSESVYVDRTDGTIFIRQTTVSQEDGTITYNWVDVAGDDATPTTDDLVPSASNPDIEMVTQNFVANTDDVDPAHLFQYYQEGHLINLLTIRNMVTEEVSVVWYNVNTQQVLPDVPFADLTSTTDNLLNEISEKLNLNKLERIKKLDNYITEPTYITLSNGEIVVEKITYSGTTSLGAEEAVKEFSWVVDANNEAQWIKTEKT